MASNFDRWERDPFFSAAEEVQESADRMESTYRTWLHSLKDSSGPWNSEELRRDLRTTLGTTKWQLEEFERAVKSSYTRTSAEDAKERHRDFITATESQILKVKDSLNESSVSVGKPPLPWMRLDEGERNELALFLSGPSASGNRTSPKSHFGDLLMANPLEIEKQSASACSKNSSNLVEKGSEEMMAEKLPGHRRTASAGADISAWKIAVSDDAFPESSSDAQPAPTPRKVPSFSGFLDKMEYASKLKWPKNGYRKLNLTDHHEENDTTSSKSQHLSRGIHSCYERNKSCLDSCDDCYDKQLNGWYGAIQRQLQRSQYHMQYSRPVQVVFWIFLLLCLIVLFALHTI